MAMAIAIAIGLGFGLLRARKRCLSVGNRFVRVTCTEDDLSGDVGKCERLIAKVDQKEWLVCPLALSSTSYVYIT